MPDIYLLIDGQQQGPYTEDQVRQSLADGAVPRNIPAWREGLNEWVSIGSLFENTRADISIVNSSSTDKTGEGPTEPPKSQDNVPSMAPLSIESPPILAPKERLNTLTKSNFSSAIVISSIVMALLIGAIVGVVTTAKVPAIASSLETTTYFKVGQKADYPPGGWAGLLMTKDPFSQSDAIVVFGDNVNLGEDDRLIGEYVATGEMGQVNGSSYRVYKVVGNYKLNDNSTNPMP